MLTREMLNERLKQPCSCGCGKSLGGELWFHPRCHDTAGLAIEFRQPLVMTLACICGRDLGDFAVERPATFEKTCHPKAALWAKYEAGWMKVYCRVCHKFIKKVRVASGNAEEKGVTTSD